MKRLAIISSYNEKCGNASYTHVLKTAFSEFFDVEVIPLDLFVLQKASPKARKLGNAHIESIAKKLAEFDYVNIQFEAGLYGVVVRDMYERVATLIKASKNLIFTMHRIDVQTKSTKLKIWSSVKRKQFSRIYEDIRQSQFERLYENLALLCNEESKRKNVWIAVHTKREQRILKDYFGVSKSFEHPLAYLTSTERREAWKANGNDAFRKNFGFPKDARIIGVFGYISGYKGIETAISTLNALPENYVLALFGSQHPQSLQPMTPIDPYLNSLIRQINRISDQSVEKRLDRIGRLPRGMSAISAKEAKDLVSYSLLDRVRFVGNIPDPEFIQALRLCDAVVLPYLEVGQSMSGVIALATECGAKMFCSNNASFAEVMKYYGQVWHSFDVGNHVELAQKILMGGDDFKAERDQVYIKYNISTLVNLCLEKFGYDGTDHPAVKSNNFHSTEVKV